jgi:integrase/recombinase XerD
VKKLIDLRKTDITELEIILPDGSTLVYHIPRPEPPPIQQEELNQLIEQFLDGLTINDVTRADYNRRLKMIPYPVDIWGHYLDLKRKKYSDNNIRNHYRILNQFASWLVKNKRILDNPLSEIKPPGAPKGMPRSISAFDIKSMVDKTENNEEYAMLAFFRETGCRLSEGARLTWQDVDLEGKQVILTGKRKKLRAIPVSDDLVTALKSIKTEGEHVFTGKRGPLTANGIYQRFERIAARADVTGKSSPQAWRHAYGRDATANGMPTRGVQKILGHSSIETTQIYTEIAPETVRKMHMDMGPKINA